MNEQRLKIAIYHSNPDIADSLMTKVDKNELDAGYALSLLASDIIEINSALTGGAVYDYESQEWIPATKKKGGTL